MKNLLILILTLLLGAFQSSAQNLSLVTGETYALVVGISDYQDEGIPDLRFADKDALAFAGFLQSPAGGELDEDHLKVLINEQATQAQFGAALDWLWEVAQENDRVLIYFSGHGDVERKSITQPGYLLCWDAPPNVYMGGGAFNVRDLNDVVSTISIQNKAKVILVTDACRAGKLSGSGIGGAQATAANLAKQYGNEIKILSCQPDEYSIEGEQWGGGRGAFSYHLLDGLYGMADGNNDLSVNLLEIGRYLEDKVSTEVAPHSQIPMTVGSRGEKLTTIFPDILERLKEGKRGQMPLFSATESRGMEEEVLAATDPITRKIYKAFKQSLKEKNFLSPEDACADAYYNILIKEPSIERLHSTMRRNYAAALQDDAQQVMNNWMKTSIDQIKTPLKEFTNKIKTFPRYLERAAELLGSQHYMYTTLIARKHFFEGYILLRNSREGDSKIGEKALNFFREALILQPEMPHAYWKMSTTFTNKFYEPDSSITYTNKIIELYPSWILPYTDLALSLSFKFKQFDKAKLYLDQAMKIDSTSPYVWNAYSVFYYFQGRQQEAEKCLRKVIQYDSTNVQAYQNLGNIKKEAGQYVEAEKYFLKAFHFDSTNYELPRILATLYLRTDRLEEAEDYLIKAITLDPRNAVDHLILAEYYQELGRWEESKASILRAVELDSTLAIAFAMLGYTYTHLPSKLNDAEKTLNKALEMDPDLWYTYVFLAKWSFMTDQVNEAWEYLEQGIQKSLSLRMNTYESLSIDFLENRLHFEEMQKDPKWNELLQKYFPDQYKK